MMQLTKEADDKMLSDVMDAVLDGIIKEYGINEDENEKY